MKIPREKLQYRTPPPKFLRIIPRLPFMVCKHLKSYIPPRTTRSTRSEIQCIFKKPTPTILTQHMEFQCAILPFPNPTNIESDTVSVENNQNVYTNRPVKSNLLRESNLSREMFQANHKPQRIQHLYDLRHEYFKTEKFVHHKDDSLEENCLSCQYNFPAFKTCQVCNLLNGTLPRSSCLKCQTDKPLQILCFKSHGKQPFLSIAGEGNQELKQLTKRRRLPRKCSGINSKLEQCFVCLKLRPRINCTCTGCVKTLPVVDKVDAESSFPPILFICPCPLCLDFIPEVVMCNDCKDLFKIH